MRGHSTRSDSRIAPSLQQRRKAVASSVAHRAILLVVARRGQNPPPSLADLAHSFIVASLSQAAKPGGMAKQEGRSLSG